MSPSSSRSALRCVPVLALAILGSCAQFNGFVNQVRERIQPRDQVVAEPDFDSQSERQRLSKELAQEGDRLAGNGHPTEAAVAYRKSISMTGGRGQPAAEAGLKRLEMSEAPR